MSEFIINDLKDLAIYIVAGVSIVSAVGCLAGWLAKRPVKRHLLCSGTLLACWLFSTSAAVVESFDARFVSLNVLDKAFASTVDISHARGSEQPGPTASPLPMFALQHFDSFEEGHASADTPASKASTTSLAVGGQKVVDWMFVAWGLGSFFMLARLFRNAKRLTVLLSRSRRLTSGRVITILAQIHGSYSTKRLPEIAISDDTITPFSVRLPRLMVVLPSSLGESFSDEQIEQILRHELAHIDRRDQYWLLLQRLTECVFWYLPMVFVNGRLLHEAREQLCDNSVLRHHAAHSYASTLLSLAESMRKPVRYTLSTQIMSGKTSTLRARVVALVSPERDVAFRTDAYTRLVSSVAITATCLAMSFVSLGNATPVQADESNLAQAKEASSTDGLKADAPDSFFEGVVLNAEGNSVVDTLVVLQIRWPGEMGRYTQTVTGVDGGFRIQKGDAEADAEYYLWAYKPGFCVRCVRPASGLNEMRLPPEESIAISLGGNLPADLVASPYYYEVPNGRYTADESTGLSHYVPPILVEKLKRRPDSNGIVTMTGITKKLLSKVLFESEELGQQTAPPVEKVTLRRAGQVIGQIRCPPGQLPQNLKVYFTVDRPLIRNSGTGLRAQAEAYRKGRTVGLAEASVDANGRFSIDAIASGRLTIKINWPPTSRLRPKLSNDAADFLVEVGEKLVVNVDAVESIAVRGRIITDDTNQPVANAKISIREKHLGAVSKCYVKTGADGWFTANVLPGEGTVQCYVLPESLLNDYQYPEISNQDFSALGSQSVTLEEIRIKRKVTVRGVLFDSDGKPLANRIIAMTYKSRGFIAGIDRTDSDGRFQWKLDDSKLAFLEYLAEPDGDLNAQIAVRFGARHTRFVLLPLSVESHTDFEQLRKAMVDIVNLRNADLISREPLQLKLR